MNCLLCHSELQRSFGWGDLFAKETGRNICEGCREKFAMIIGETCRICGRPLAELTFKADGCCHDCIRWEKDEEWTGCLQQNSSACMYNDFCKEAIALFKYRGDYKLAAVFAQMLEPELAKMKYDLLVPIPLSNERLYERGFNQAEALITEMGKQPALLLTRLHTEKQSKKSREDRIRLPQVFRLEYHERVKGKRILLIDDIYTTGSTLRHAAKLLKKAGAVKVSALTIARG